MTLQHCNFPQPEEGGEESGRTLGGRDGKMEFDVHVDTE